MAQAPAAPPPPAPVEEGLRVPPGAMVQYYSDLASGLIAPEDMRIEDVTFTVQIDPQGNVVFETDPIEVLARYNLAIRGVSGWVMDPDILGPAGALVRFQLQEAGRNFTVFKRPVNMQSLLSRDGGGDIVRWDGVYICVPGTTLEALWTVDTNRWPALVGAAREFGIQLLGDYVACAPGP
jgi:hypothetical protein